MKTENFDVLQLFIAYLQDLKKHIENHMNPSSQKNKKTAKLPKPKVQEVHSTKAETPTQYYNPPGTYPANSFSNPLTHTSSIHTNQLQT